MTTAIEGSELIQTGPGSAMGELMRQYWIPAVLSSELASDGAPVRLMLLGEKLIAFRDSSGKVGVMDHRCPHRGASLFLGRNEEGGIRCIYHGWKFDVAGNCLDMPNVTPQQDFKHKVKAKAYPAVERAGLVWVYMGSRAEAPPMPALEILDVPEAEIKVSLISATATICRRSRVTSTPRISASCTPVRSIRTNWRMKIRFATLSRFARRSTRSPTPPGARSMPASAPRAPARPTGAAPTSCFRSGSRPRTGSSTATCTRAPGCRWTTATPCSFSCGGRAARRR